MALTKIFSIDELLKPVTQPEARDALYNVLARLEVDTTQWPPGAVTRAMTYANSMMFSALSELQAEIAKSGFLDYATGTWLRLIARLVYGVTPIDATFATGEVTLTNNGGGLYSVDAGDLVVANTVTGKTYKNLVGFDLGAGSGTTVTVSVIAEEAGSASNANSAEIGAFVTQLTRVTVSNATALIAVDAESPAALRTRCREKLGALSPMGPWDAYAYAARTAKTLDGTPSGIIRTRVTRDGYGNLYLTVASATGVVAGAIDNLTTPLGAADDAVQRQAAPLGVTAHTASAVLKSVSVSYHAWAYNTSGRSDAQIKALVATAMQAFFVAQPIGGVKLLPEDATGYVFTEALSACIHNAVPEIFRVALITPAADAELAGTEVPVLLHDPVTQAEITQVAPPEGAAL